MPSRASTSLLHMYHGSKEVWEAPMCQCPHGLVPHCYSKPPYLNEEGYKSVSMPSRASTSLLPIAMLQQSPSKIGSVNALTG